MKTIYKSELKELEDKEFDTVEALEKAEAEINEKMAAKQKLAETRKAEADVVKQAITKRIEAEMEAKKIKWEAYKKYLETCDAAEDKVTELKNIEKEEVKKFSEKYGGFHDTITIGDVTYSYDYSVNNADAFKKLITGFWL